MFLSHINVNPVVVLKDWTSDTKGIHNATNAVINAEIPALG